MKMVKAFISRQYPELQKGGASVSNVILFGRGALERKPSFGEHMQSALWIICTWDTTKSSQRNKPKNGLGRDPQDLEQV